MEIVFAVGILGWIYMAWKWADWKRFREFRATIYILIAGDLLYNTLTEGRHLWTYDSPTFHFTHNFINVIVTFGTFPFTVMLFLTLYPEEGIGIQALYNLTWSLIYITHEWLVTYLGIFSYHHGWNIWWSLILNLVVFPFLRLHQTKPLWAVPVFILSVLAFSIIFRIPITAR